MDRGQFEDLMLTDPKIFASYARLFIDLAGTAQLGFLDWCWEKWLEGTQPSPHSTGFSIESYAGSVGAAGFKEIRV